LVERTGGSIIGAGIGGFILVVASAFCYSSLSIFGKIAYAADLRLVSLLAVRFSLAAALFWALVLLSPRVRAAATAVGRRRALQLLAWGTIGYAGQSGIYFSALQLISASLTSVLLYTSPAFIALMIWGFKGRRPGAAQSAAIVLALSGTYLCAAPQWEAGSPLGVSLAVLAGFWQACFLLGLASLTRGIPSLLSGAVIITGAAVTYNVAALLGGGLALPRDPIGWASIFGLVIVGTILSFLLFIAGLKRVGPQVASILCTFEPVGTVLLASVVLNESLLAAQWLGAALIVGAACTLAVLGGSFEREAFESTTMTVQPGREAGPEPVPEPRPGVIDA
jgi:drug/metabolite transporter (DMT)-like permease